MCASLAIGSGGGKRRCSSNMLSMLSNSVIASRTIPRGYQSLLDRKSAWKRPPAPHSQECRSAKPRMNSTSASTDSIGQPLYMLARIPPTER